MTLVKIINNKYIKTTKMADESNLQQFGNDFVYEYYATLSKYPYSLSKYYKKNSIFVYYVSATETLTVVGQKDIHECIVQLGYKGCITNIFSTNTQNLYNYIVISVIGKLAKHNSDWKTFSQTIVLDCNDKDESVIKNNMFFYSNIAQNNSVGENYEMYTKDLKKKTNKKVQPIHQFLKSSYPPVSHQLFVSGIPANSKPQDLRHFFEQYGQLHSLRIMKKNVNYGFITYAKSESTYKVLQNRPIVFPDQDGVWLVVKAKKKTFQDKDNTYLPINHQLFIGDIPDNVTSDELKNFFSIWGEVVSARIMITEENPAFNSENIHGFVTFETEQSAKAVLENKPVIFPNENGIELKVMEKLYTPNKKKSINHKEFQNHKNDDKTIIVYF